MPASAAARLLGKLGEAALKRYKEQGVWRAAPLSSMDIAELRKEHLLAGREWPYEDIWPGAKKPLSRKRRKGHKWEKELSERKSKIEENMNQMSKRIADYKKSQKLKNIPLLDQLTLMPKQIREKHKKK